MAGAGFVLASSHGQLWPISYRCVACRGDIHMASASGKTRGSCVRGLFLALACVATTAIPSTARCCVRRPCSSLTDPSHWKQAPHSNTE